MGVDTVSVSGEQNSIGFCPLMVTMHEERISMAPLPSGLLTQIRKQPRPAAVPASFPKRDDRLLAIALLQLYRYLMREIQDGAGGRFFVPLHALQCVVGNHFAYLQAVILLDEIKHLGWGRLFKDVQVQGQGPGYLHQPTDSHRR